MAVQDQLTELQAVRDKAATIRNDLMFKQDALYRAVQNIDLDLKTFVERLRNLKQQEEDHRKSAISLSESWPDSPRPNVIVDHLIEKQHQIERLKKQISDLEDDRDVLGSHRRISSEGEKN